MADSKVALAAGSDAEVVDFLSASEGEATQQEVTPELLSALVKQVEFYFSDANLPTDKKLLKQIRKDPEGFVPVKLFANFRKVRALSKDVGIITEALRGANLLQLSSDSKRVKRIAPVPEYDIADIQRRTIVVENLPGNPSPTIESVTEVFRMYGRVKLVRICSRESKGKLPSWLTSSCQSMVGQQHAYVEFEEEEGAVLAAAALAAEGDASDGTVQVRRLLNCIAEHRERRSGAGAGSSYGGSLGGSRKGSRDVSPLGSRSGSSRRNSSGGGSFSCGSSSGGGLWGSVSSGGAAADSFFPPQSLHHTYGGAFEQGTVSRRGSGGGCGSAHPQSQPPPPPRRSSDSAPSSDLAPAAVPTAPTARLNVYRPPAKRISDGYTQPTVSAGGALVQRACDSSSSIGSSGDAAPCPACVLASPALLPPPPPAPRPAPPVTGAPSSPPLSTRRNSAGGGKPPAHPPAALATNALAEAIAAVQAERRASEAGAKASGAAPTVAAPAANVAASNPAVAVAAALAPMGLSAPKYCLNLAVRGRSAAGAPPAMDGVVFSPRQAVTTGGAKPSTTAGAPVVPGPVAAALAAAAMPRNTQMVANVEDFINNILARPASRPMPAPQAAAAGSSAPRKANATTATATVPTHKAEQRQAQPVNAAAAVADILASTLRRPVPAPTTTTTKASAGASPSPVPTNAPSSAAGAASSNPVVYITAIAPSEAAHGTVTEIDLEHAVAVTVHCCPTPPGAEKAACKASGTAPVPTSSAASNGIVSSASSSPRESTPDCTGRVTQQACSTGSQRAPIHVQQQQLQHLPQTGKRASRREYAQWAAATPEYRAEAASKYSSGVSAAEAPVVATGGVARCSAGGIVSATHAPLSFGGAAPSSISDGGAIASTSPVPHAPSWHVARGPDGSRGFVGRRVVTA